MPWKIAGVSGIARQVDVYVDFDGTIAPTEPTDALFDRFADPAWREFDAAWQAGRLASWEATAASVALLRASPEEIAAFLKTIPVDPAFPAFVALCRRMGLLAKASVAIDGSKFKAEPRQELHARQDGAADGADRGERRALS